MENTQVEKINSSNRLKKTLSMCILGLFLFLILILVYEYFRIVPENVRFTNVTSSSVTVSWNTKNPISATAVYKKGDGGFINLFGIGKQVFYDTRDLVKAELKAVEQTSKNIAKSDDISVSMSEVKTEVKITDKGKYYTHHVEIRGLDPETEYSFFVGDDLLYKAVKDIDGNTVIKTTKVNESVKTPVPAYGSIYDSMNTELTFDQLAPINDGIVYFNYVDRITGKKSNLFSGVLNEEGNWYIDVVGAVDDEGKPFMETYDTVEGNVYVELNINAGNLGIWRKTENAYVLTPATNTVINMPNAIVDPTIEGSVVRVDEDVQTSVKGASDNTLARVTNEPCECPNDYPNSSCPYGKVCESKVISGTTYCSQTICYKVKVNNLPPCECTNKDYPFSSCPNGKVCESKVISGTSYCSQTTCYKVKATDQDYVPPCKCPNDYPYRPCPNGKVCESKVISGTSYCSQTTCYKVKVTPPPPNTPTTKDCSHFSTFDCNSACYFINSSGNYEKCNAEECNMEKLKALGLDCDDDANKAAQENNSCAGGAKLGQCTYVKGEECKQCKWVQNKWGGYRAIWSRVDLGLCGTLRSQSVEDCQGLPNCTDGKLNLKDNTCICNTGYQWDTTFERCVKINTNTCYYLGQSCVKDGKEGYCTGSHECKINGEKCSPKDGKEREYRNGVCEYVQENNIVPTPAPICTKGDNEENNDSHVCNEEGVYVTVGNECDPKSPPVDNGMYHWNDQGNCVLDGCYTPYILVDGECKQKEIRADMPCDPNDLNVYWIHEKVLYKCNKTTQRWEEDKSIWWQSNDLLGCRTLGSNQATNISCSNDGVRCIVEDKMYVCLNGSFVEDTGLENIPQVVVFADLAKEISQGELCKNGNDGCKCKYKGRILILSENEWCPFENCIEEGQICDTDGKTCSPTPGGMGVPAGYDCKGSIKLPIEQQLDSSERKPCTGFSECQCNNGADKGKTIKEGQYCREVDSCDEEGNVNKICNQNGNTCSSDKKCNGDMSKRYTTYAKQIPIYENCTLDKDVIYPEGYQNKCLCPGGMLDITVGIGKYCRNTNDCSLYCNKEGTISGYIDCGTTQVVCNENGDTCIKEGENWTCKGPRITKPQEPEEGSFLLEDIKGLISSVINFDNTKFHILAESKNTSNNFMIDQKEGMFVNIQDGQYTFEYEGEEYYFFINDMSGSAKVVIDKNNNNQYDEGTDILVSDLASIVQIEPIELRYTYVLKQGFNFVSFPFLVSNQEYRTAAGLLKKLNDIYEDSIYSIAKYDGSWKIVGQNEELYSSNDFQLLPGQGYVIKAKDDVIIDIWGKPIKYDKDSPNAPVALFKGWNLVGLYGSGIKQYTAKTLLEDINKYEKVDFSADNVSKWDNELQRYEGFQVSDKNGVPTEYGFNYVINLLNSYFVRVQDGEGNWQPELAQ